MENGGSVLTIQTLITHAQRIPSPLPRIDQLMDVTARHELLSFMDAYSGYNQIRMCPEDEDKMAFTTDHGLYYYKVMSFGLKNARAIYQQLVNKVFANLIGKTMEVYIDDHILVKSHRKEDHSPISERCLPYFGNTT